MAVSKFTGYWSKEWQDKYNIPKGHLLIKPKEVYVKDIAKSLLQLKGWQDKGGELRELDVTIEYHYRKGTFKQKSTLFALYEILASEMNGGMSGDKSQNVTPYELYVQDVKDYAPRFLVRVDKKDFELLKRTYTHYHVKDTSSIDWTVMVMLGASMMDSVQLAEFIDRLFNRLAHNGVSLKNAAAIKDYWIKWRQHLNDNDTQLHSDIVSADEYKEANPICEATGNYLGDGSGHLAHINSRGMGGKVELWKNYASNWLHLSNEAHNQVQHQKGWSEFTKQFPHLENKVNRALKATYELKQEWKNLEIF